jgi:alpha-D-ribose 1-methylphosphonate 5-triphosphate synthase subunit PhnG
MINEGSAEVQVSNLQGNSSMEVAKGNVKIQLGECDNYELTVSADEVTTSSDLQVKRSTEKDKTVIRMKQGGDASGSFAGKMDVTVGAGSAQLEKSSWIASLNLRKAA